MMQHTPGMGYTYPGMVAVKAREKEEVVKDLKIVCSNPERSKVTSIIYLLIGGRKS
jgi:hypothetical protein